MSPLALSFYVATFATPLAAVFGIACGLLLARPFAARNLVDALVTAPMVLPPTVLGYYLLVLLGRNSALGRAWDWLFGGPIVFTFTGAVIAASAGSLPLVVRSIRLGLESVEPNLIAAARTLGARPVRVIATVVLPLAAPGLVAGAMLGFARSLGDYGATQMLAGARIDGVPTASIFVMDQLLANHDDQVFAMSLATTIVGLTLLYFANRLTHRLHHHRA